MSSQNFNIVIKMEFIKNFFQKDKFAQHVGIELLEVEPGRAKTSMLIKEEHLNAIGSVHGGALFTLADYTFAVAANSYGNVTVAINANISFMKSAKTGMLIAEAKEISLNPKLSTYTIDIYDSNQDLIAIFQGMAYRKKDQIKNIN